VLEIADCRGEYCGKLLADLGADVIKIEAPEAGTAASTRRLAPFYRNEPHEDGSLSFLYLNANKRSMALDLESADGVDVFERLAASADVVVVSDRRQLGGVDTDRLSAAYPQLVVTYITDYGLTGPWSGYLGSDLTAHALGGSAVCIGRPDDPPVTLPARQAFTMASAYAAASSLAALHHAQETGCGQLIDISVVETVVSFSHVCGAGRYLEDGIVPARFGTGLVASVPSGAYRCSDGLIYLMVNRPLHWRALARWIHEVTGNAEVLDRMFDGPSSARQPYRELIDIFIGELCERFTVTDLYHEAQRRHLAMTPVAAVPDLERDPHLKQRGYFVEVVHEHTGAQRYPGPPYRPSKTPWAIRRPAPRRGQHTEEILAEIAASTPATSMSRPASTTGRTGPIDARGALAGLRIVEFGAGMAGPWIGRFMAWAGAEVIKVESRDFPDVTRLYVPPRQPELGVQDSLSPWFTDWNAGKRFVALDLTKPKAADLCARLVAGADFVIENFSCGVLEKLGLGHAELRKANPTLIMLSSTGYGGSGPYRRYVTWGPNIEALSGLMRTTGFAHRDCAVTQYAYPDPLSAVHGLVVLLAALDHRRRSGEGQHIDMSQYEATVSAMGTAVMEWLVNESEPQRLGNRSLDACVQGIYRCAGEDRWCAITCETEQQFRALCDEMGRPDLVREASFDDREARLIDADAFDRIVDAWTCTRPDYELMHTLQAAGIPAAVVQNVEDQLSRDPQLAARGFFERIEHKKKGPVLAPGIPLGMSGTPGFTRGTGSSVGEDNEYVIKQVIGLSDADYASLVASGVIEDR